MTVLAKNSFRERTMGLRETRPPHPLYRRITADLVLPPDSALQRHVDHCALATALEDGHADIDLLRFRGHLALLDAPCSALGPGVQAYPQDTSPVFRTVWYGC